MKGHTGGFARFGPLTTNSVYFKSMLTIKFRLIFILYLQGSQFINSAA